MPAGHIDTETNLPRYSNLDGADSKPSTCAEHRGRSTRSEWPLQQKRNHPRPRLMDTSRIEEVKAPPHAGTPRAHHVEHVALHAVHHGHGVHGLLRGFLGFLREEALVLVDEVGFSCIE